MLLVVAVLFGCSKQRQTEQSLHRLRDILNQADMTTEERFAVLERKITNGMPVSQVVQLLGTNYRTCYPYSTVMAPPLTEADKRISLWYSFPQMEFSVETSNPLSGDPLSGTCTEIARIQ
jgi:hypothetical protein